MNDQIRDVKSNIASQFEDGKLPDDIENNSSLHKKFDQILQQGTSVIQKPKNNSTKSGQNSKDTPNKKGGLKQNKSDDTEKELGYLKTKGLFTLKEMNEIKGCTDELDQVSILNFICDREF